MRFIDRRNFLRGALGGGIVTIALPLLDYFLDGNGAALASGAPMPVRFGNWFWALGMTKQIFVPTQLGANYELPEELVALKPVRDRINVLTEFNVYKDAHPNACHHTGWVTIRTGITPAGGKDFPGETIDVTVANEIGSTTRFRSLSVAATADSRDTVSYEGQFSKNAADASPVEFYQRIFGGDFVDPNAEIFIPNPRIMAEKSVLSPVIDKAKVLEKSLGAVDRARLDEYFTGLREVERQIDQQLKKPEPREACVRPKPPQGQKAGVEVDILSDRHRLMTDLLVMAVACDQTRVFSMSYAKPFAETTRKGYDKTHHSATHEELVDVALGYQPTVSWFTRQAMESWAYFVQAFSKVKEGDSTLLDNSLIFAHSDVCTAKVHSLEGIPMFTAGRAGGKVKTGLHVSGEGNQPATRVGYTVMRAMGLDIKTWGAESNKTSKEIGEILA